MSNLLFDVPRNKTRLELAKETHQIETYKSNIEKRDKPWLAIVRPLCVEALGGYGVTKETPLFDMFAGYRRLLDEADLVGYGETEADAVLEVCRQNNIAVIL